MSFEFPRAAGNRRGYAPAQVDALIERARLQHQNPDQAVISASELRNVEFDFEPGGYLIAAVDSAIDRLEDSFAAKEIARLRANASEQAVADRLQRVTDIILGRLSRKHGRKFAKTGILLRGYSRRQVDRLCADITNHFEKKAALDLNSVRRATFKSSRNGYREAQVDAFIDRVIEALQIEKNSRP